MEKREAVLWGLGALTICLLVAGSMGALGSKTEPATQSVSAESDAESLGGKIGPDVIVGELNGTRHWGSVGEITAYSVGTTSCNVGDENLLWISNEARHPVIGQNMFRHKDGRLTQIGQSWLKHGFLALAQNACNLGCQNPNDGSLLGVGCSDPYGSSLNGSQGGLGPRFEVNASNGSFEYPFFADNQTGNTIYKRLQVQTDDVDPDQNTGARYFVEGHYVTPDDAAAGNQNNNASYREVMVESDLDLAFIGDTVRELPAIHAWQAVDPEVELTDVDVRDDGRFIVAGKVTDNLDGTWRYDFAIHNLNSHRSGASFSVPLGPGTTVTDVGFHDVDYHSGEPYEGTDWGSEVTAGSITWSLADMFQGDFESGNADAWGQPYFNENANALRWGTMYNFWFTADQAPGASTATLGLYRPGNPASVSFTVQGPQ